jgi:hypothetical protein
VHNRVNPGCLHIRQFFALIIRIVNRAGEIEEELHWPSTPRRWWVSPHITP